MLPNSSAPSPAAVGRRARPMLALPAPGAGLRDDEVAKAWVEAQHPRGYHGRWVPKVGEIEAAARGLGIEDLPVVVKPTHAMRGRTAGHHEVGVAKVGGKRTLAHVIRVDAAETPESASETIWHELTHAAQSERIRALRRGGRGKEADELRRRLEEGRYRDRLEERVARDNERRHDNRGLADPNAPDPGGALKRARAKRKRYAREMDRAEAAVEAARNDPRVPAYELRDLEWEMGNARERHRRAVEAEARARL